MIIPSEIILLFFIISFLIYTMPTGLVVFSKTPLGKIILLILMVLITLYNKTGGLLIAMLIIFLSEFNYEVNNENILSSLKALNAREMFKDVPIGQSIPSNAYVNPFFFVFEEGINTEMDISKIKSNAEFTLYNPNSLYNNLITTEVLYKIIRKFIMKSKKKNLSYTTVRRQSLKDLFR